MRKTHQMHRIPPWKCEKHDFCIDFSYFHQIQHFGPKWPILADFRGEKIKNHHMGNYRHIDMFSGMECHPEIDSARLEI